MMKEVVMPTTKGLVRKKLFVGNTFRGRVFDKGLLGFDSMKDKHESFLNRQYVSPDLELRNLPRVEMISRMSWTKSVTLLSSRDHLVRGDVFPYSLLLEVVEGKIERVLNRWTHRVRKSLIRERSEERLHKGKTVLMMREKKEREREMCVFYLRVYIHTHTHR